MLCCWGEAAVWLCTLCYGAAFPRDLRCLLGSEWFFADFSCATQLREYWWRGIISCWLRLRIIQRSPMGADYWWAHAQFTCEQQFISQLGSKILGGVQSKEILTGNFLLLIWFFLKKTAFPPTHSHAHLICFCLGDNSFTKTFPSLGEDVVNAVDVCCACPACRIACSSWWSLSTAGTWCSTSRNRGASTKSGPASMLQKLFQPSCSSMAEASFTGELCIHCFSLSEPHSWDGSWSFLFCLNKVASLLSFRTRCQLGSQCLHIPPAHWPRCTTFQEGVKFLGRH